MSRARLTVAVGVVAVLVAAGCGDDQQADVTTTPAGALTTQPAEPTTASSAAATEEPTDATPAGSAPDTTKVGTTEPDDEGPAGSSAPSAEGMPSVTFEEDGTPVVSIPDSDPPAATAQVELRAGDGPEVADGDVVTIDAQMVHWETGEMLQQTWGGEPLEFDTTNGISRIREAVIGQLVGTELLLVLPPQEGAEPNGQPNRGVEDDDTLVFVIDIVDARQP